MWRPLKKQKKLQKEGSNHSVLPLIKEVTPVNTEDEESDTSETDDEAIELNTYPLYAYEFVKKNWGKLLSFT